jgi:hypothetical protein
VPFKLEEKQRDYMTIIAYIKVQNTSLGGDEPLLLARTEMCRLDLHESEYNKNAKQ